MATDHEEKMVNLTRQMRHNQSDLQSFISDLDFWESDIKKKEEKLLSGESEKGNDLPPVRNTIHKKKLKKKKKEKVTDLDKQKQKIPGYDFRAWDKFDVDAALDDIDQDERKDTSSSEYETDEEWEMERKKHLAGIEKEKGNKFFKNGDYNAAVESYSRGMELDSTNAVLPANRAMALLKQQKYAAAELDCTRSVSLDPLYVKAYLRRATARANLTKHGEAMADYNRVLDLEPSNKMAHTELERLQKEKERDERALIPSTLIEGSKGVVKAIYKSPEERSKVPLKRIPIEEIGIQAVTRVQQPLTEQSELTRKLTEREGKNFETLICNNHTAESSKSTKAHEMPGKSRSCTAHDSNTSHKITEFSTLSNGMENSNTDLTQDGGSRTDVKLKVNGKVQVGRTDDSRPRSQADSEETIPNVPQSSFQFQTDFKLLKNKTEAFFQYFTSIKPSHYPVLFGQCLDADILQTVLNTLLQYGRRGSEVNVYDILLGMSRVRRFSMTAMFLSQKEKQGVRELMDYISSSDLCSSEELSSLRKKYDL